MTIVYRVMTTGDYQPVYDLWAKTEGIGLSEADSPEGITQFLARNPDLSYIALDSEQIVGAAMCGHDGRRGYLHHVAVAANLRRQGIGAALADHCLSALAAIGIDKCHLFAKADNVEGHAFWQRVAWIERDDIRMMSRFVGE